MRALPAVCLVLAACGPIAPDRPLTEDEIAPEDGWLPLDDFDPDAEVEIHESSAPRLIIAEDGDNPEPLVLAWWPRGGDLIMEGELQRASWIDGAWTPSGAPESLGGKFEDNIVDARGRSIDLTDPEAGPGGEVLIADLWLTAYVFGPDLWCGTLHITGAIADERWRNAVVRTFADAGEDPDPLIACE